MTGLPAAPTPREAQGPAADDGAVVVGDVELDPVAHAVLVGGRLLAPLPVKEFQLLHELLRHPGCLVSREQLLARVWGDTSDSSVQTIDVHIARLRKRLEDDPHRPSRIRTVRNVGYGFFSLGTRR